MAKSPNELLWIEDLLQNKNLHRKPMFGGFGYYDGDKMMIASFESQGDTTHRGQKYSFEIWNGLLFPLEKEFHQKALKQFPILINHPVLPKWLYLPLQTENFDDLATSIIKAILKPQSYWGVISAKKKKKSQVSVKNNTKINSQSKQKKKSSNIETTSITSIDMKTPKMFSDDILDLNKAKTEFKNISDFKNLGPESEKHFHQVGIKTPKKFIELGWKKTWDKLVSGNINRSHTLYGYALIGALENKQWNGISDEKKKEASDFAKQLRLKYKKKKS